MKILVDSDKRVKARMHYHTFFPLKLECTHVLYASSIYCQRFLKYNTRGYVL